MRTSILSALLMLTVTCCAQCTFLKYDKEQVVVLQSISVGTSRLNFVLARTPNSIRAKVSVPADSTDLILKGGTTLKLRNADTSGYAITNSELDELVRRNLEGITLYMNGEINTLPVTDRDSRIAVQQQALCVRDANLGTSTLPQVPATYEPDASAGIYLEQASMNYNMSLVVLAATVLGIALVDTEGANANTTRSVISVVGTGLGLGIWLNGNSKLRKAGGELKQRGL